MSHGFEKSNALLQKALGLTPLGAQTFSKSFRYFCAGNSPSFLERGKGCRVWDVDGNEFVDFICALGPITVGYNDERVNHAITQQLQKGIIFSQPSPISVELAEKLSQIVPCAQMVRFVKNGSDATSAAIRLARAFTGRDHVAVCGYHGMQDWYIGSTVNRRGVPGAVCDLSHSFSYNDLDSLRALLGEYPDEVAAVIMEPIQADGPQDGYLESVKELAQSHGALLIFDEVVSGFRYALGGASELYNVVPDMAAFGKGMGNGMPISAVAGRRDVMELIGTQGVFISTTFGGDALSMAASLETIRILEQPGVFERFWELGNALLAGLRLQIEGLGLSDVVSLSGLAPHAGVSFEGKGNLGYLDVQSVFQQRMIQEGILSLGINNINCSHTEQEVGLFLRASNLALEDVAMALKQDSLEGILHGGKVDPIFKRNISR